MTCQRGPWRAALVVTLTLVSVGCGAASSSNPASTPTAVPSPTASPSPTANPSPLPPPTQTGPPPTPPPAPPPTAPRPPPPPPTAGVQAVGSGPFAFSPVSLAVAAGTRVIFTNSTQVPHTFTADGGAFDSRTVGPSQTFAFTFAARGSYPYHCAIHPYMTGAISVG